MPNAIARLAAFALAFAPALAVAQGPSFYKWIDADGKVQYSDKPPKAFKGEVTRIEHDFEKYVAPPAASAPGAAPAAPEKAKALVSAPDDPASKRRATRASLEARLARARADVEAARKALSDGEAPELDERQTIQQRGAKGGMHGMTARSNCRVEVGKDGKKSTMCPTSVPTAEYHDRVARQEEAVRKAEEELAAAEEAWRRGVD